MGKKVHYLSNIDEVAKVAWCASCGSVGLRRKQGVWRCKIALRKWPTNVRPKKRARRLVLAQAQNGCCAICDKPVDVLHVDHCHQTGKVRGGLCRLCNMGLGLFRDNSQLLAQAIDYLKAHSL